MFSSKKRNPAHDALDPMKDVHYYNPLLSSYYAYLDNAHKSSPWPLSVNAPPELVHEWALSRGKDAVPEMEIQLFAAVAGWNRTQQVYRFDPDLARELIRAPLEGEVPSDLCLQLPDICVFIETKGVECSLGPVSKNGSESFADIIPLDLGFYAYLCPRHLSSNPLVFSANELELVIVRYFCEGKVEQIVVGANDRKPNTHYDERVVRPREPMPKGMHPDMDVYGLALVPGKTVEELHSIFCRRYSISVEEPALQFVKRALSLLLYLVDVQVDYGGRQPPRRQGVPHRANPSHPTIWPVGVRVGAALRKARRTERSEPKGGSHASPRAHVRRGHHRLYWTGPGGKIPRIQWISAGLVGKGESVTTVRPVREKLAG